jgi:2-oxoglutarate ferredoxin oxidoreductase subunit alpha
VVVMSYGITSRVCMRSIREARAQGLKVGHLRLLVVWPFPEKLIRSLAKNVRGIVFPEVNLGQVVLEAERCAGGQCKVVAVPHAGGAVHDPQSITDAILEAAR